MKARSRAVLLTLALGLLSPGAVAAESKRLFALVVGCNSSPDADVPALRYADDDAIQNAKLLGQLGAEVVLLTTPDRESAGLHPRVQTTAPSKAAVLSAMVELNRRMREARKQGQSPVFYFFYSGHGDVKNNQGQMTLEDSPLSRDEFLDLLGSSDAEVNHVVIDACKSYFMVFERGQRGERNRLRASLTDGARTVPNNTGIFLSTSAAADSHEWEAFQGGVFSHEMRSALRGAADANGDGLVTYEEAAAFIWNANRDVPSRRYRPDIFFRPAGSLGGNAPILADLRRASGDHLVLDAGASARAFVEDGLGIRYLDLHVVGAHRMELLVPAERPLYVRWPGTGTEAEVPPGASIPFAVLSQRSSKVLVRGAEQVAFGRLFFQPFDEAALVAFRARPPDEDAAEPKVPRDWIWARRGLGLAGLAVGISAGILTASAVRERNSVGPTTTGRERERVNHRIDHLNLAAGTCYAVAGTAILGYLVWTLWPHDPPKIHVEPPSPETGQLRLSLEW
jgi:hypothetical protein